MINSPEAAQKFVGKLLYIKEKNYPKLRKNEFYYEDLERLDVFIVDKKNWKSCDVLIIMEQEII